MKIRELLTARLAHQRLSSPSFDRPEDVVAWLGAVQSQERLIAPWSIAQRMRSGTAEIVQKALADGDVIRTHALRPTWHYLARDDFRWIMDLTAPRVRRFNSTYYKGLGVDEEMVAKGGKVIESALRGGAFLTRPELDGALKESGIAPEGFRLTLLVMQAELDQLICSGPPRGKLHTYALVDRHVPAAPALPREEALARLATRYFQSHGPATVRDFVWWSSLTVTDARNAIQAAGLVKIDVERAEHWAVAEPSSPVAAKGSRAHLLQTYDEYIVAYKDSRHALDSAESDGAGKTRLTFAQPLIHDGRKVGSWRAAERKGAIRVEVKLDVERTASLEREIDGAVARFASYAGRDAAWAEAAAIRS